LFKVIPCFLIIINFLIKSPELVLSSFQIDVFSKSLKYLKAFIVKIRELLSESGVYAVCIGLLSEVIK